DARMPTDDNAREMSDAQPRPDRCPHVYVDGVPQIQALVEPPSIAGTQTSLCAQVLRNTKPEQVAEFVVLACPPENVEQQADFASGLFLVGALHAPTFKQLFEIQDASHTGLGQVTRVIGDGNIAASRHDNRGISMVTDETLLPAF